MYRLSEEDINRLIRACELYKHETGSEFLVEKYQILINKLKTYREQNLPHESE
ncbi:hypothetical protein SCREM1_180 [Synechococcus phage S-CREM1]|nr:hypothetical protein SCREM1_180 [Synechococcus phage S-CREM1]